MECHWNRMGKLKLQCQKKIIVIALVGFCYLKIIEYSTCGIQIIILFSKSLSSLFDQFLILINCYHVLSHFFLLLSNFVSAMTNIKLNESNFEMITRQMFLFMRETAICYHIYRRKPKKKAPLNFISNLRTVQVVWHQTLSTVWIPHRVEASRNIIDEYNLMFHIKR